MNEMPQEFCECVHEILTSSANFDASEENSMQGVMDVGCLGWRFRFSSTAFFVTTFALCQPETSSRYAFGSGRAFLFLQPEHYFYQHNLPPDTAHTHWDDPKTIHEQKHGKPFDETADPTASPTPLTTQWRNILSNPWWMMDCDIMIRSWKYQRCMNSMYKPC